MAPNVSKWLQMASNSSKWLQVALNGSEFLSQVVLNFTEFVLNMIKLG